MVRRRRLLAKEPVRRITFSFRATNRPAMALVLPPSKVSTQRGLSVASEQAIRRPREQFNRMRRCLATKGSQAACTPGQHGVCRSVFSAVVRRRSKVCHGPRAFAKSLMQPCKRDSYGYHIDKRTAANPYKRGPEGRSKMPCKLIFGAQPLETVSPIPLSKVRTKQSHV